MGSTAAVIAVKRRGAWSRANLDSYLIAASLGILAGMAVSFLNTPLHLPGHKVLFWMVPAVAHRFRSRSKGAATTTVTAAQAIALLLGGSLAGGALMAPLVILAGFVLDIVAHYIEQHWVPLRTALAFLALAGMSGNLLCFMKRLANPMGPFLSAANGLDLMKAAGSHVLFGALAAVLGGSVGLWLWSRRTRP
jgi:hypothetical protein